MWIVTVKIKMKQCFKIVPPKGVSSVVTVVLETEFPHHRFEEEDTVLVTFVLLRCWGFCEIVTSLAMLLNNHIYSCLLKAQLEECCLSIKKDKSHVSQRYSRGLGG